MNAIMGWAHILGSGAMALSDEKVVRAVSVIKSNSMRPLIVRDTSSNSSIS
jgi:hypothetical protein